MITLFNLLFGCSHSRQTFPLTETKRGFKKRTYTVCLECGAEFPYQFPPGPDFARKLESEQIPVDDNPPVG